MVKKQQAILWKCQIINSTAESIPDAVVPVTEANTSYNCFRYTQAIVFTSITVQRIQNKQNFYEKLYLTFFKISYTTLPYV